MFNLLLPASGGGSDVLGTVLTGYSSGAGTVSDTDTVLEAIEKLNGNTAVKVGGPGSSTDNALMLWSGTGGYTAINSTLTFASSVLTIPGRVVQTHTITAGVVGHTATYTPPSSGNTKGMRVVMNSGYSGVDRVLAFEVAQNSVSTGFSLGSQNGGFAIRGASEGNSASATNVGVIGETNSGLTNYAVVGWSSVPRSGVSRDVGVVGLSSTGGSICVGGYFHIGSGASLDAPVPSASTGLLVDNGDSGSPIALFQAAGSTVAQILASGSIETSATLKLKKADVASAANITALACTTSLVRLSGNTATTLDGIATGTDGQVLWLMNPTGQNLTIKNNSGASTGKVILCPTGADVVSTGDCMAMFMFDSSTDCWRLMSFQD